MKQVAESQTRCYSTLSLAEPAARPAPRGAPEGPPIVQKVSTGVASGCPERKTSTARSRADTAGTGGSPPHRDFLLSPASAHPCRNSTLPGRLPLASGRPAPHAPPAEVVMPARGHRPPPRPAGARRVTWPTASNPGRPASLTQSRLLPPFAPRQMERHRKAERIQGCAQHSRAGASRVARQAISRKSPAQ